MDSEMDIKAMGTVKGKTYFVFYTGSTHQIAEDKEELIDQVSKWSDTMLKREKKE